MKELDVTDYDPDRILGHEITSNWWHAINVLVPTVVDPDVAEIYLICLDLESFFDSRGPIHPSAKGQDKKSILDRAVQRLMSRYNPEEE